MNAPVTQSTLQPIPPIWQFSGTFYVGEGSSATVFNPAFCKVYPPRPMINDLNTLYSRVKTLTKQMWDRFKGTNARNEMLRIRLRAAEEKAEYNHMEAEYYKNHWARVSWYYNDLSGWEDNAVRVDAAGDHGVRDGIEAAIRAERERVREEATRAGGPTEGLAAAPVAQECAVGLCCWLEKMESTFGISECAERRKVKFATATLHVRALTWWNSQIMIDEFCPTEEVQRLEDKLRHLKLRDMNIVAYTERFNKLALLCHDVVPNENKKVELYIKGLPEIIKGKTTSSRPTMLNDDVRMVHTLMEQKI
ncbi:putative reverse transcriptase domain-containing protein [Tanacetum coccineum]